MGRIVLLAQAAAGAALLVVWAISLGTSWSWWTKYLSSGFGVILLVSALLAYVFTTGRPPGGPDVDERELGGRLP